MKKIIAIIMVLLLSFGAIPTAAATGFSDVTSAHWAKPYIDDMTERGLFTGFGDGTFRPNDDITLIQSLVLLSRMYSVDEESKQLLVSEYNSYLKALLDNRGMSWAIPELAVCLEAGIVTKAELTGYATGNELGKPVEKELLSVFLVRTMQLEDEALSLTGYTLPFEDYLFITYTRRPYCYILYKLEIVSGDTAQRFNPKLSVSRAVSSTMVSRTLTYLEKENIELKITRFSEYSTRGILSDTGAGEILVKDYDGTATRIIIPNSAYTRVNGVNRTLSSAYSGHPVTLVWSKEDDSLKGIEIDTTTKAAQGAVKSVSLATATPKIYLTDTYTAVTEGYTLGDTDDVDYEGTSIALTSLKVGSFATVLMKDDIVTDIFAYNGAYEVEGSVRRIIFGDPITLVMTTDENIDAEYLLNPRSSPYITRDGRQSSVDKLRTGDRIKITIANSLIKQIDAEIKKADLSGTVKSIVRDILGNHLIFVAGDGTEYEYPLASGVQVTQGQSRISMDNLRLGSKADFVISDGEIIAINIIESITESNRITGSIVYINTREQSLLLKITHENGTTSDITVELKTSTKILNATSGANVNFSTLEIYDVVDIFGAYDGDMLYEATIIIVR